METPPSGPGPNRVPVDKSPVLAFLLTFFLGPLGLLYVKVVPALLLVLVALTGYYTFGVTTAVAWIVSIVWACVEASRRHRALRAVAGFHRQSGHSRPGLPASSRARLPPGSGCPPSGGRLVHRHR